MSRWEAPKSGGYAAQPGRGHAEIPAPPTGPAGVSRRFTPEQSRVMDLVDEVVDARRELALLRVQVKNLERELAESLHRSQAWEMRATGLAAIVRALPTRSAVTPPYAQDRNG